MSTTEPSLPAIDEVRELNRLFLAFLRERPGAAAERYGLSPLATELITYATPDQIRRAASFPRALFRIHLPTPSAGSVMDPLTLARGSGERVLELVLLHSARNLSRISGYAARLLLRLDDNAVNRLRTAEVDEIISMSLADNVVHAAFDDLAWIWRELLHEARPEYRRRLLLIGFQPDLSLQPAIGLA
ncbi:MAG TPA: hypothetical protein VMR74_10810 [Gammaproteobacteria bacterium]|nr:hypothetical protein [Gammaproteobacteria bacterium]